MVTLSTMVNDPSKMLDVEALKKNWGFDDGQIKTIAAAGSAVAAIAADPVTTKNVPALSDSEKASFELKDLDGRVVVVDKNVGFIRHSQGYHDLVAKVATAVAKAQEANNAVADMKTLAAREVAIYAKANELYYGSRTWISAVFFAMIFPITWIFSAISGIFCEEQSIFVKPTDPNAKKATADVDAAKAAKA